MTEVVRILLDRRIPAEKLSGIEKQIDVLANENNVKLELLRNERDRLRRLIR